MPDVCLVNPLPVALRHYEASLRDMVEPLAGVDVIEPDIELGDRSFAMKVLGACVALARILRAALRRDSLVVLWPAFGPGELALWGLFPRGRRLVVIHDPVPLRHQYGYGRLAMHGARWGSRRRHVEVIAHTQLARQELERLGICVAHVVAHPTRAPRERDVPKGPTAVTVLGQHKDARDLALLTRIAETADPEWELRISGRGWPRVPGWVVTDRFLTEEELDDALDSTHVVLLPYEHYFQSGIATRAFERGVPVVAHRHEFIESLFGGGWPGIVEDDSTDTWLATIERTRHTDVSAESRQREHAAADWCSALRAGTLAGAR